MTKDRGWCLFYNDQGEMTYKECDLRRGKVPGVYFDDEGKEYQRDLNFLRNEFQAREQIESFRAANGGR